MKKISISYDSLVTIVTERNGVNVLSAENMFIIIGWVEKYILLVNKAQCGVMVFKVGVTY